MSQPDTVSHTVVYETVVGRRKHDDERNITWSEIEAAAEANGMSPQQAVANMQQMAQQRS